MSTTPPPIPVSATRMANEVIAEHGVTPDRLEIFFTGQDPELLGILTELLNPMTDAELGIIGGMGPGRDDRQSKSLADAGLGHVLNKFSSGHQILVNLAAVALALHMYNMLTAVTEGLTTGNAKSREAATQVEAAFGSGDEDALKEVLRLIREGADVAAAIEQVLEARRRAKAPRPARQPDDEALRAATT